MATLYLDPRTFIFEGKTQIISKFIVHYKANAETAAVTVTGYDENDNSLTLVNAVALPSSAYAKVLEVDSLVPVQLVEVSIANSEDLDELYGIEAIVSHSVPIKASTSVPT